MFTKLACSNFSKKGSEFIRCLLVKTAPVLLGVKPAVLIRFNRRVSYGAYDIFSRYRRGVSSTLKLGCIVMKRNRENIHVLFYRRDTLEKVIFCEENKDFLEKIGYERTWDLRKNFLELKKRFESPEFPHEIGIFLGYPLKDVKGFIAQSDNCLSKGGGRWKIYGEIEESLRLMHVFRMAEEAGMRTIARYGKTGTYFENIEEEFIRIEGENEND